MLTWKQWIGNDITAASVTVEKKLDSTSSSKAIIIDNSDDEIEEATTPVLPRKFRVPPAAGLVTPLSVDKVVVAPEIGYNNSKIVVDLESDHEEGTPTVEHACSAAKYNTGYPTPQSLEKESANPNATKITKKAKRTIKGRSTKAKKRSATNNSDMEPDDDMPMSPPTIGSTRKRRAIDYHKALSNDQDVDNPDEDYEYEEIHDDRRLDEKYDSLYPVLATPSKRQKKTKS